MSASSCSTPARRGRGLGHDLLRAAESDLEGVGVITIGADPPYFLYPGVPVEETALCCLLERHHYAREETNYNIEIELGGLPPDPGLAIEPRAEDRAELDGWMTAHWPHWRGEVMRAFDRGSLVLGRDGRDITGFCAYDVNRSGTLGAVGVATRPHRPGVGAPLLLGALHRLRALGRDRVDVLWVGPMVPYARLGGHVSRLFFVYRLRRAVRVSRARASPRASSPDRVQANHGSSEVRWETGNSSTTCPCARDSAQTNSGSRLTPSPSSTALSTARRSGATSAQSTRERVPECRLPEPTVRGSRGCETTTGLGAARTCPSEDNIDEGAAPGATTRTKEVWPKGVAAMLDGVVSSASPRCPDPPARAVRTARRRVRKSPSRRRRHPPAARARRPRSSGLEPSRT